MVSDTSSGPIMSAAVTSTTTRVKAITLGDFGVGKVSFVVSWLTNSFLKSRSSPEAYLASSRAEPRSVTVDGETVMVLLYDPLREHVASYVAYSMEQAARTILKNWHTVGAWWPGEPLFKCTSQEPDSRRYFKH